MKKLIISLLAALALIPAAGAKGLPTWGGRYVQSIYDDNGELFAVGELIIIPVGSDGATFCLTISDREGSVMTYDTDFQALPVKDNRLVFYYPDEEIEYSVTVELSPGKEDGCPEGPFVKLSNCLESEYPPYASDIQPEGYYILDGNCFLDPSGYLYAKVREDACVLVKGGLYQGKVSVPEKVKDRSGAELKVLGVSGNTFQGSLEVTGVSLAGPDQMAEPGTFIYTAAPYDWNKVEKPHFAYPGPALSTFVIPAEPGEPVPSEGGKWVIFKHFAVPATLSGDTRSNEEADCGRKDWEISSVKGVFYQTDLSDEERAKMFRGYESYEVETIVCSNEYAAFHTFPSFSRWKYPEGVQDAPLSIEAKLALEFDRGVLYSRRVAWLREGPGELDIIEFEHKDRQAMVAFVWQKYDEIVATCTLTTGIPEGEDEDYSIWAVDDDGTYGIPDVVTIALDRDGNADIFVAKNSPESIRCFILHQNGSTLEQVETDYWYRYLN